MQRWDAVELASWSWSGLRESRDDAPAIGGRPRYNGGEHLVGSLRGPIVEADPFDEAIASWSAQTPAGTWIEVRLRVSFARRWTRWYSLGVWAETTGTVARHSVPEQRDADGEVLTDVLRLSARGQGYQAEGLLFSLQPEVLPVVRSFSVVTSTTEASSPLRAERAAWGRVLEVPQRSQMVYPDGGEAWCSPTAVSMVLAHYGIEVPVPSAAADTYDWAYDGCGNWSFNTAYAARFGLDAYVARFASLFEVERAILAGNPIVTSYAWEPGELDGAPVERSAGHLGVVVGFDERGNPVVNDPAAPNDAGVRRAYPRGQFERQWLVRSSGTAYVIRPADGRARAAASRGEAATAE